MMNYFEKLFVTSVMRFVSDRRECVSSSPSLQLIPKLRGKGDTLLPFVAWLRDSPSKASSDEESSFGRGGTPSCVEFLL